MSLYFNLPPPKKKAKGSSRAAANPAPAGSSLVPTIVVSRAKALAANALSPANGSTQQENAPSESLAYSARSSSANTTSSSSTSGYTSQSSDSDGKQQGKDNCVDSGIDTGIPGLETIVKAPDIGTSVASSHDNGAISKSRTTSKHAQQRKVHGHPSSPRQQEYNPRQPNDYFEATRHRSAVWTGRSNGANTAAADSHPNGRGGNHGTGRHAGSASGKGESMPINHSAMNGTTKLPAMPQIAKSRVIVLSNLALPGQVDGQLHSETHTECSRFGRVLKLVVYEIPGFAVRVFVKYETRDDAARAKDGLHGRYFEGRMVNADWFEEARFEKLDLGAREGDEY